MIKLTAVTDTVHVRANLGDMRFFTGKEIGQILLPGTPIDNALAVLALGVFLLPLARVAYGPPCEAAGSRPL